MKFTAKIKDHTGKEREIRFMSYLPLEKHFALPGLFAGVDDKDPRTYIPLFQEIIESWTFEGSPQDATAYGKLDVFVMQSMGDAVLRHLRERRGVDLKN